MAQFQIVTCSHKKGKDTVNPRGGFSFDVANLRIMHHRQCAEIPFNPHLPHSSLHALKCWDAWIPLTICYSSPSMKQVSLLRFPGWLTTLQSFELKRNKCHDPLRHTPLRPRSYSQLSVMFPMGISSCAHSVCHAGHCCVVSKQQLAMSQCLVPLNILSACSRARCDHGSAVTGVLAGG